MGWVNGLISRAACLDRTSYLGNKRCPLFRSLVPFFFPGPIWGISDVPFSSPRIAQYGLVNGLDPSGELNLVNDSNGPRSAVDGSRDREQDANLIQMNIGDEKRS